MSSILSSTQAGVRLLTLNRPDKFNSFNREMALLLQKELDAAAADKSVRAVLITGEGKAFCAGQDLAEAIDVNGPGIQMIVRDLPKSGTSTVLKLNWIRSSRSTATSPNQS